VVSCRVLPVPIETTFYQWPRTEDLPELRTPRWLGWKRSANVVFNLNLVSDPKIYECIKYIRTERLRDAKFAGKEDELVDCVASMPLESINQFELSNNLTINVYELSAR